MDAAYLHLLTNHVPILGTLFGLCLILYAVIRNDISIGRAALVTFIFSALIAIVVLKSGEEAEHMVEEIKEVSHDVIHEHEEISEGAFWAVITLGLLSLGLLIIELRKSFISKAGRFLVFAGSIAVFIMLVRAGLSGGEIRHTEITNPPIETQEDSH